jgi:hypothetical protein
LDDHRRPTADGHATDAYRFRNPAFPHRPGKPLPPIRRAMSP